MKGTNKGAVYVATGKDNESAIKTATEAVRSSRLLKHFSPGLHRTIVVDNYLKDKDFVHNNFDRVVIAEKTPVFGYMGAKTLGLKYCNYDEVVILDNDTVPVADIRSGFSFLSKVRQIALSLAPRQEIGKDKRISNFQNGVMFVRNSKAIQNLFDKWHNNICKSNPKGPSRFIFSNLLNASKNIGIYPLSYYWNFRIDYLLDFDVKPSVLERIFPLIRVFHTHFERQVAVDLFLKHPRFAELRDIGGLPV